VGKLAQEVVRARGALEVDDEQRAHEPPGCGQAALESSASDVESWDDADLTH
jgi:hypothetical protein